MGNSKPLGIEDESGFEFVKEMLNGDSTYAINFDRIQWDSKKGNYAIVEFLLCDEKQQFVTPYTSHPNKYFFKNKLKFTSLWEISQKLEADLYLINYAKKGTKHENEVLFMKVIIVNENNQTEPVKTENIRLTREKFSEYFRAFNKRGEKSNSIK